MENRDNTITIQRASLHRLAYTVPLCSLFLYFTKMMLFGPNILWLPGVMVGEDLAITFSDQNGRTYLSGYSEFNKPEWKLPEYCRGQQNNDKSGCLEDPHNQLIKIVTDESGVPGVTCHQVKREGLRCVNQMVMDCYNLGEDHWYGGFEAVSQMWPLRKAVPLPEGKIVDIEIEGKEEETEPNGVELVMGPYITADSGTHNTEQQNVLERLFFSSSGVGIMVAKESPLYLSFNQHRDGKICLAAVYDGSHYSSPMGKPPVLEYTVCKADNVKTIQNYMRHRFIRKPEGTPNLELFRKPIWSTWAQYNKDINQTAVLEFADKIISYKFPASQLEIDDDWTVHYGDLDFNPQKFPDPKKMIADLTRKGFPVTLWTHPFISLKSQTFQEAYQNKYAIMTRGSETLALTRWWNEDMAAVLDVTNPAAVLWYQKKLMRLQEMYNITSFKFDAGEGHFVPHSYHTLNHMESSNDYTTLWAELALNTEPSRRQEVRVAWNTQRLPMFVRLQDRMSTWDRKGGLASIIPAILTFGVIGYPFVLPDMIGGNAYADTITWAGGAYPERELYIRWLQLNTFLPALQFSVVPWQYDSDVVAIAKKFLKVREEYISLITDLAEESVTKGYPIIRPLWWIDPLDEEAQVKEDEFLVGNSLLVAPVIVEGARKRDIYLPAGLWKDKLKGGEDIQGPATLKDYSVALNELAFFERGD